MRQITSLLYSTIFSGFLSHTVNSILIKTHKTPHNLGACYLSNQHPPAFPSCSFWSSNLLAMLLVQGLWCFCCLLPPKCTWVISCNAGLCQMSHWKSDLSTLSWHSNYVSPYTYFPAFLTLYCSIALIIISEEIHFSSVLSIVS